jgi:hypothetical protein
LRLAPRQRRGAVGELDGDDPPAGGALLLDPVRPALTNPMDARTPRGSQRVPDGERVVVVVGVRDGDAGADGVAGAQQRPEVRPVGDPQRRGDEVPPASVLAASAGPANVAGPGLRGAQRAEANGLS